MVNVNIVRTAMGIIGNVISFFYSCHPRTPTTFKGIVEKKDTEKFHPYPYLATLMNCALWVFYGSVHPDSFLVQLINGIGLGIEFIYIFIFFLYTKPRNRKIMGGVLVLEIVAMSVIVVCSLKFLHTSGRRSEVVGYICMIFNIIMYASPCSNMINVIKEKSARFITIWLCVAGFFNGICWTAYGFLKTFDKNLVIPNGIGVLCSAIMIILYLIYRNNDDKLQQTSIDVKPPKNVQLADVV